MTASELELDGLRRTYGTVTALDGLSFGVPAGQVFGFLGPNGAGKTTAMRAIFGVTGLDAGEIRWHGAPVDEQARRRFGYMPEERGLYPSMRLLEQVEYFALLHDMPGPAAACRRAYWKTTVRLPFSSTRCWACQVTARASTWASTSRPASTSRCGVSEWSTRTRPCSMIGPSSRSGVT